MAHGMTGTDGLVLAGKPAWHGLGKVVVDAPTPRDALKLAGLDWEVEQWPLVALNEPNIRMNVPTHVLNVRSDNRQSLGVVGNGYKPVHNRELAEFAEALGQSGDNVLTESAGSIMGGRKVWFLIRGNSFHVKGFDDAVHPYLLLANGHDGGLAFHVRPTSVRVVCKNTLTMSLGQKKSEMTVRFRHEGDIQSKLREAKRVLGMFDATTETFREKVDFLSGKTLGTDDMRKYFVDVYSRAYEPIPKTVLNSKDYEAQQEAQRTLFAWGQNFDRDSQRFGASMWTALNVTTEWFQHKDKVRGKDTAARAENQLRSMMFGTIEDRTNTAAALAMSLAG